MTTAPKTEKPQQGHRKLSVTVFAPRFSHEPKTFTFERTETVGHAARTAADAFGYGQDSNPTFATEDHVVLDRNDSLVAAHVHDGDELELVDVGGGV